MRLLPLLLAAGAALPLGAVPERAAARMAGCWALSGEDGPAPAPIPGKLFLSAAPQRDEPDAYRVGPLPGGGERPPRVAFWRLRAGRLEVALTDGHAGVWLLLAPDGGEWRGTATPVSDGPGRGPASAVRARRTACQ